jgi:hypothetical protein
MLRPAVCAPLPCGYAGGHWESTLLNTILPHSVKIFLQRCKIDFHLFKDDIRIY